MLVSETVVFKLTFHSLCVQIGNRGLALHCISQCTLAILRLWHHGNNLLT